MAPIILIYLHCSKKQYCSPQICLQPPWGLFFTLIVFFPLQLNIVGNMCVCIMCSLFIFSNILWNLLFIGISLTSPSHKLHGLHQSVQRESSHLLRKEMFQIDNFTSSRRKGSFTYQWWCPAVLPITKVKKHYNFAIAVNLDVPKI